MENSLRYCERCDSKKSIAEFSKHIGSSDGINKFCKECNNKAARIRYKLNADKERARKRADYQKNPVAHKQRVKKWSEKNYEQYRSRVKAWTLANPDKVHDFRATRRSRKRQNGVFVITRKEIKALLSSSCFYCGSKETISLDHVIPISRGGRHSIGNLVAACRSCNSRKNARFITEWKVLR